MNDVEDVIDVISAIQEGDFELVSLAIKEQHVTAAALDQEGDHYSHTVCPPVNLHVCVYVCISVRTSVCKYAHLSICVSICPPTCQPADKYVFSPVYLPVYLSICLFVYLSAYLFVSFPACLPVCLTAYLPVKRNSTYTYPVITLYVQVVLCSTGQLSTTDMILLSC